MLVVLKEKKGRCILNVEYQEGHAGGRDVVKAITATAFIILLPLAHW